MRIEFNRAACTGHGRCYVLAPAVYESDDDGYNQPRFVEVPAGLEEQARTGAANCPEEAITVVD